MTNVRPSSSSIEVLLPWGGAAETVGSVDGAPVDTVVEGGTRLPVVVLCAGMELDAVELPDDSVDALALEAGGLEAGGLDADGLDGDGLEADGLDADGPVPVAAPEPVLPTAQPDSARATATSTPTTRRPADASC